MSLILNNSAGFRILDAFMLVTARKIRLIKLASIAKTIQYPPNYTYILLYFNENRAESKKTDKMFGCMEKGIGYNAGHDVFCCVSIIEGVRRMCKRMLILLLIVGAAACGIRAEKTWLLKEGEQWVDVSAEAEGSYLLDVSEFKQLVTTGQAKKAGKAFAQIKEKYPDIAGAEMDAFGKCEMLYAQRKYLKAFEQYSRFMDTFPQSALDSAALERQYGIARAFLYGQKKKLFVFRLRAYEEAAGMIEKIVERTGDTPMAKKSMRTLAESYEARKKFMEAFYSWSEIRDKWSDGQIGQDALLSMAGNLHAAYRGLKFDTSMLATSKSNYEEFTVRYPQQAQKQGVGAILSEIDEQLANKELDVALYYERTSSVVAANLYFQRIIEEWPGSAAAKIAAHKLEKS